MSFISSVLYLLLALAVLIAVHEWGHFYVARLLGIKVIRFAIGFGKPLFTWVDKLGTEYALCLFPLGGYVKMLDEEEDDNIPPEELKYAFNRKPIWARIAVVAAGPAMNMVFAVFALWLMFLIGIKSFAPLVGDVAPGSIAAKAGVQANDEIITVDGAPIKSWRDFQMTMMSQIGEGATPAVLVKDRSTGKQKRLSFDLKHWQLDYEQPDILKSLGIEPYVPYLLPQIDSTIPGLPGEKAGFKSGDVIKAIDGQPVTYWYQVLDVVRAHPNQMLKVEVARDKQRKILEVTPELKKDKDNEIGFVGLKVKQMPLPDDWIRVQRYGAFKSLPLAWNEMVNLTNVSFNMIWKFVSGRVSLRNIGGPIGIAQGAEQSARVGLAYFLAFLALISVSLGVLNILPVPILDGGHIVFYLIEAVRGKPLTATVKERAMIVGMIMLMALTVLAVFNDMVRLLK